MRRVAITGIGLITPLGTGAEATWAALLEGRSSVGPIRAYDAASFRTQLGAEILDYDPTTFIANRRQLRMMTRNDQFALTGALLAAQDSGLDLGSGNVQRTGVFVGGNKEISDPMHLLEGTLEGRNTDGSVDFERLGKSASKFHPLFLLEGLQAASLFYVSDAFKLQGANAYFAGLAESSATAVGRAYRSIRRGESDAAVAGGFDDPVSWWSMTKLDPLGMLTSRNDLGRAACRPYDSRRTGTVMGEGAAMLVLEEYEAARERGARIYAEITGVGSAFDGDRLITPHPQGRGLAKAIDAALCESRIAAHEIGYISSHGAGTKLGDRSEARGIRTAFGAAAEGAVGSTVKPAVGHMGAAAGAMNVAVAALAVHHGTLPPTLNLERPDPSCRLDWVPLVAREARVQRALAVARGFEGQNVVLALQAP
jgi:3-oxoacyl-[acyl-carrier-protein] synthase II